MVVWREDGRVTTVVTLRPSMDPSVPTQAVPPYDAEDTVDEEADDEDEEETVSSMLVVVNPQELQPDDDDAASFQLVTPPLLLPQHDLGVSGSGSNSSNTFEPALYVTGVWTPSQPQDWRDELEHGPDPVFVLGRQHGTNLFAAISVPRADTNLAGKETKEGESKHHDGEDPDEAPATAAATEMTVAVITEAHGPAQEQPAHHCLDRRSTVAKLALACWCLLAVLAALEIRTKLLASETYRQSIAEIEAQRQAEARRQVEERLRAETEPKAMELSRRACETFHRLAEEPYNQEEVARMTESHPMRARFASLEELIAFIDVINTNGGRDLFVADLAKNHGRAADKLRRYNEGDNDGVIYAIINRVDLKVYVGQTDNFDARIRAHFNTFECKMRINDAIRHGRKKFVSVILLAGIEGDSEINSAEIAAIQYLDCLWWNGRGYNKQHGGGRGGSNYVLGKGVK